MHGEHRFDDRMTSVVEDIHVGLRPQVSWHAVHTENPLSFSRSRRPQRTMISAFHGAATDLSECQQWLLGSLKSRGGIDGN